MRETSGSGGGGGAAGNWARLSVIRAPVLGIYPMLFLMEEPRGSTGQGRGLGCFEWEEVDFRWMWVRVGDETRCRCLVSFGNKRQRRSDGNDFAENGPTGCETLNDFRVIS